MDISTLINEALAEDIGTGDVTTTAVIPPSLQAEAHIEAQATGVICGLDIARQVFRAVDAQLQWQALATDGTMVDRGSVVAVIKGAAASLLRAERVGLNFCQRLSGIATLTRRFVDAVAGTNAVILDTRKTTPGWRALEKYAVTVGGGISHRHGLYDRYLMKSNHIDCHESIESALECLMAARDPKLLVEVEARDLEEVGAAAAAGVDIIMLDNFPLKDVRQAVAAIHGRTKVEVSGGITLDTVRAYAETGVDYISVGALTHSAPALAMHLTVALC